jgi:hypothetical protein
MLFQLLLLRSLSRMYSCSDAGERGLTHPTSSWSTADNRKDLQGVRELCSDVLDPSGVPVTRETGEGGSSLSDRIA